MITVGVKESVDAYGLKTGGKANAASNSADISEGFTSDNEHYKLLDIMDKDYSKVIEDAKSQLTHRLSTEYSHGVITKDEYDELTNSIDKNFIKVMDGFKTELINKLLLQCKIR